MVSIDDTPLTPDDVKVKQRSGLYPVKVPYSWFPTVRLVEKRSFFPRCLRFQGFLNLKVYYVLHRFAFQVAIGGKNTKETKSNRAKCFLGVSCSCHSLSCRLWPKPWRSTRPWRVSQLQHPGSQLGARPSGPWKRWRGVEEKKSDSFRQKTKRKLKGAGASEVG